MTQPEDRIPVVEGYKGVGLHADQSPERLAEVRAEIDQVIALEGRVAELLAWVEWRPNSPESRLLAAALVKASVEEAQDRRRTGPAVDLLKVGAHVAGLDGDRDRNRFYFDTKWAPRWAPDSENRPVRRPVPLPDSARGGETK